MIRAEIIVKGRVQKAGYRDFVDEKAFKYNLKGSIENLEDKTVKIECEGPKENIKRFVNDIRVKKYPIHVEDIEVDYYPDVKGFTDFEIIREKGEAAVYERLDTAAYYLREMNSDLSEKIDGVGDKIDTLDENLGGKIDTMDKNLGNKIDGVGDKVDRVGGKIDTLDENLGGKIDKFSMATAEHFNSLDSKYHIVSENLIKISENNRQTSENLNKLVGLVETLVKERSNRK